MKKLKFILIPLIILFFAFWLGPRPEFPDILDGSISKMEISLDSLDKYVSQKDAYLPNLKLDNESRIIWSDSLRKTPYSLVYLHGFSASPMESADLPEQVARRYGMNLYIPLLAGHGQDDIESFKGLKPNDLIRSSKEAIAIGNLLGDHVVLMSCSTGSTLGTYLGALNPDMVDVMLMYSPNFRLADPFASMITGPWGKELAITIGGEYWNKDKVWDSVTTQYWTTIYRTEGLIALQKLIDDSMSDEIIKSITDPYFIGYYFKNKDEQDPTISTEAILEFTELTATPVEQKKVIAFPDAEAHVITNPAKSKQSEDVKMETFLFLEEVIGLKPIDYLLR